MDMWEELEQLTKEYRSLNLQDVVDYEKFCMMSVMWHSTKIEGCSLSETDTKVLLENDITAKGKPLKDHLMLKDHFAAFLFVAEQAGTKRKMSKDFIQNVGAHVMKNTGELVNTVLGSFDVSKGDFRIVQVYVDHKYFPDFSKVDRLITQFCDQFNKKTELVEGNEILRLAADLHYNFVNIHPFGDGNGRTARLLMNYVQLYHQQPLIKIFTEDRSEYIDSLNATEEHNDPEIFRNFICSQQIKFLKLEIEKYRGLASGFNLIQ